MELSLRGPSRAQEPGDAQASGHGRPPKRLARLLRRSTQGLSALRPRRISTGHAVDIAVAVFYTTAAALVMRLLWVAPTARTPAEDHSDQVWFEWMLVHAVRIFTHGENPFRLDQLNVPQGVNLLANTHALGLTIPMIPVTATLGPGVAFVLMITLGLAGTAYAWYWVLSRHLLTGSSAARRAGALVGGLVCGFGPGMIAHANGHPNITAQFLVPFIVWRGLALRSSTRRARDAAIVGVLVAYQAFVNEEVLLDTAIAMIVFVVAYAIFHPSSIRRHGVAMLTGAGLAALVAAVLLAYPLWVQFRGPGHVGGLPLRQERFPYTLPLASYIHLPTLSPWGQTAANHALANRPEENSFLGLPLLALVAAIAVLLWRRRPAVPAMLVVGALFAWGSLGNQVIVSNPKLSYPYSLWSHLSMLPVFSSVLPTRLALVTLVVAGILAAMGTAAAAGALLAPAASAPAASEPPASAPTASAPTVPRSRQWPRWRRIVSRTAAAGALAAIVATLVTLAPQAVPVTRPLPVPAFFQDGTYRAYVPDGYSVVTATPMYRSDSMAWSLATGLNLPVASGYFLGPDATGRAAYGAPERKTDVLLRGLEKGAHHPKPASATRQHAVADLRYWHASIVVLAPGYANELVTMQGLNALLGPVRWVDGVWLWDVRPLTDGPPATYRGAAGLAGHTPAVSIR